MNIFKVMAAGTMLLILAAWTPDAANRRADTTNVVVGDGCSGTVIDKDKKLIATAWHCIRHTLSYANIKKWYPDGHFTNVIVEMRGPVQILQNVYNTDDELAVRKVGAAFVVGYYQYEDVAVLAVATEAVTFNDEAPLSTRKPRRGDAVWHIGNPYMLEGWISRGTITSTTARMQDRVHENLPVIFFDASMEPGSSGGALYNDDGELIGTTNWAIPGTGVKVASPVGNLIKLLVEKKLRSPA